ncbi:hypothetical protein BH23BAC1_BH23BAC1_24100 [soil metagenome]
MKDKSYLVFVADMIEAIEKIKKYLKTVDGLSEFSKNEMVIDAVTRNFEILGEASKKIPKPIKEKHPEIPWKQMYSLRNLATHEYHKLILKSYGK